MPLKVSEMSGRSTLHTPFIRDGPQRVPRERDPALKRLEHCSYLPEIHLHHHHRHHVSVCGWWRSGGGALINVHRGGNNLHSPSYARFATALTSSAIIGLELHLISLFGGLIGAKKPMRKSIFTTSSTLKPSGGGGERGGGSRASSPA